MNGRREVVVVVAVAALGVAEPGGSSSSSATATAEGGKHLHLGRLMICSIIQLLTCKGRKRYISSEKSGLFLSLKFSFELQVCQKATSTPTPTSIPTTCANLELCDTQFIFHLLLNHTFCLFALLFTLFSQPFASVAHFFLFYY